MCCRAVVLRGVFVRGVIAAADVTALETEAEMDPGVTGRETLLAALRSIRAVIPRATKMSANRLRHHPSLRYMGGCWNRRTGDSSRYRKARAAMIAAAKSVGRSPTRSPTMPAANAAGGATANPTNRVAELTRPSR
jgi:hypothetical protein